MSHSLTKPVPNDGRKYTKTHEWIKKDEEGDLFLVGITEHACQLLGDIVHFGDFKNNSNNEGAILTSAPVAAGEQAGVIESVKTATEIFSPIDGELVASNNLLHTNLEELNADAYNNWIFKIKATNSDDIHKLLNADEYQAWLDAHPNE